MTHTTHGIVIPLQAPSAGRLSATSQLFYLSCQLSFVDPHNMSPYQLPFPILTLRLLHLGFDPATYEAHSSAYILATLNKIQLKLASPMDIDSCMTVKSPKLLKLYDQKVASSRI